MEMQVRSNDVIEEIRVALPDHKYSGLEILQAGEGEQRDILKGNWGPGKLPVIIKRDKKNLSPQAQKLADRGLNTAHEIKVLSQIPVDVALVNHISPIIDYIENNGESISVEPEFQNSLSLRRRVEQNGALNKRKQFENVFMGVAKGVDYLHEHKKLLHRDLNPSNILVREVKDSLESRLTDLTTAIAQDVVEERLDPTCWGKSVLDPKFAGYTVQTDIYSVGANAIFGATGKLPVLYDLAKKTGTNLLTGEKLTDKNGNIIPDKHEKAIELGLSKVPRELSSHKSWIRRCLTLDESQRFKSSAELVRAIEEASKPSLWQKIKSNSSWIAGLTLMTGLTAAGLGTAWQQNYDKTMHDLALKEAGKYEVKTDFDGKSVSVGNNICNLELSAYIPGTSFPGTNWSSYPKQKYLKLQPGQKISFYVRGIEAPWPRKDSGAIDSMPVEIYFDGVDTIGRSYARRTDVDGTIKSSVYLESFNQAIDYDMGSQIGTSLDIETKTNMAPGVYYLSTLIYPPSVNTNKNVKTNEDMKFQSRTNAIGFKRIPVLVGNTKQAVTLREIKLGGYTESVDFCQLNDDVDGTYQSIKDSGMYKLAISVPEEGYLEFKDLNRYKGLSLPRGTNMSPRTLQIAVFNKEEGVVNYTSLPIQREAIGRVEYIKPRAWEFWKEPVKTMPDPVYWWGFGNFSEGFAKKTIENRSKLEGQIRNYFATNQPASSLTNGLPKEYTIK